MGVVQGLNQNGGRDPELAECMADAHLDQNPFRGLDLFEFGSESLSYGRAIRPLESIRGLAKPEPFELGRLFPQDVIGANPPSHSDFSLPGVVEHGQDRGL